MNTLKLNQLEKNHLSQKEMNQVQGGNDRYCLCGCRGSSSTDSNGNANLNIGEHGGYSPNVPATEQAGFYR